MPYISRNFDDQIVGLFACEQYPGQEFLEDAELYVPPPAPIDQIRAIEAPNDDNRKKITRQFMLAFMFKEAKELAPGMTDAQIQAYLMAQGKGYAKLYLEEQQIIPIRALIP